MAFIGLINVPAGTMAEQQRDGGGISVGILKQDGKAQSGAGPGDVFVDSCPIYPLSKRLICTVCGG